MFNFKKLSSCLKPNKNNCEHESGIKRPWNSIYLKTKLKENLIALTSSLCVIVCNSTYTYIHFQKIYIFRSIFTELWKLSPCGWCRGRLRHGPVRSGPASWPLRPLCEPENSGLIRVSQLWLTSDRLRWYGVLQSGQSDHSYSSFHSWHLMSLSTRITGSRKLSADKV